MKLILLALLAGMVSGCVTEALQRRMDDTRREIERLETQLRNTDESDADSMEAIRRELAIAEARHEEQKKQAVVERKEYVANFASKAGGITKLLGGIVNSFNPAIGGILSVLGIGFGAFGGALSKKNGGAVA